MPGVENCPVSSVGLPVVRLAQLALCMAIASGCSSNGPAPAGGGGPVSTGQFPHAAIQLTSAPWDGAATQLFLSENSLDRAKLTEPRISIIFYVSSSELSGHRLRLEGIERERGEALWVGRDGRSTPLKRAEVSFDAIRANEPATGHYDVSLPDGRRETGRFRAEWWPAQGRGG